MKAASAFGAGKPRHRRETVSSLGEGPDYRGGAVSVIFFRQSRLLARPGLSRLACPHFTNGHLERGVEDETRIERP